MAESPDDPPWDDDEELTTAEPSVLDALDVSPPQPAPTDEDVQTVLFTATNPTGSVAVTVLMDGRVLRVDLAPGVTAMTESQLAEEITLIATLARQQAQAGQHAVVAELMSELGHDRAATRSFLERELGLPAPDTVVAEKAKLFALRYAEDGE